MNRNLIKRLNIIEKSRGKPNFLKDSATSCIGLKEDKSTIQVKVTISLEMSSIPNITPCEVICIPKGKE
jgi:hypothetical protein